MVEKKGRGARRSDRPPAEQTSDLKAKRAEFVQTFFKKGAEFTEELVKENSSLRHQISALERENTQLRTQLASDTAIRDLLAKIKELEVEKENLLSSMHEAEETTGVFANRFAEIEGELENFANLYVASSQLHSTLKLRLVLQHLKELLLQLVGVRSMAYYVIDAPNHELVVLASEGAEAAQLPRIALHDGESGDLGSASSVIERTFLTGVAHINERAAPPIPVVCVPMRLEDETLGVIVVFSLLPQKKRLVNVDFELFKLLGAHAATALVGAQLFAKAGEKAPPLAQLSEKLGDKQA